MRSCSHHRANSFLCHWELMAHFKEMESGHWWKPTAGSLFPFVKSPFSVTPVHAVYFKTPTHTQRCACPYMSVILKSYPSSVPSLHGNLLNVSGWSGRLKGLLGMSPVSDHCTAHDSGALKCLLPCPKVVEEAEQTGRGAGVTCSNLYEALRVHCPCIRRSLTSCL